LYVDHGECRDKQHHKDCRPAVQGEVHDSGVIAETALWTHNDHDRSGPGWITHQGTSHQLHSSQLARSSQTELPGRIHYSSCQGLAHGVEGLGDNQTVMDCDYFLHFNALVYSVINIVSM